MPTVRVIPKTKVNVFSDELIGSTQKKKAAAYARVSTDTEEQLTSYEAQKTYYENYIRKKDDWEYAGIYADEGITGTLLKNRKEFNRMVDDAVAGKIDVIITKSVSRFARNTVDTLKTVRMLKDKGVEVVFEKENIRTFDPNCELVLTIMASLAQEESHSISKNVQWGWSQRIAAGKVSMAYGQFLGYEKGEDGKPKIVESEAKIVRKIYRMFLEGKSPSFIARHLTSEGIPTPTGRSKWSTSSVTSILKNEKYCGNALLQKTFIVDYLTHKAKQNEGEKESYFVTGSHPAIVSQEIWDMAQFEFEKRSRDGNYKPTKTCFSGKLYCADCGGMYGSKVWHSNDKYRRVVWRCNKKYENKKKCETAVIDEDTIKAGFLSVFNSLITNRYEIMELVQATIDKLLDTEAIDDKIIVAQSHVDKRVNELSEYVKLNMRTAIAQDEYRKKYSKLNEAHEKAECELKKYENEKTELINRRKRSEAFMRMLKENDTLLTEFDEGLFAVTVENVNVYKNKLVYVFKDGYTSEYEL